MISCKNKRKRKILSHPPFYFAAPHQSFSLSLLIFLGTLIFTCLITAYDPLWTAHCYFAQSYLCFEIFISLLYTCNPVLFHRSKEEKIFHFPIIHWRSSSHIPTSRHRPIRNWEQNEERKTEEEEEENNSKEEKKCAIFITFYFR